VPIDPQLLEPYDELIPVSIEGRVYQVPANNTVLRVLQYLDVDLYPCRLCWNGECDNCRFSYTMPGQDDATSAKACATLIAPGMRIHQVPAKAAWPVPAAPGPHR